jgi:hypothetical protein
MGITSKKQPSAVGVMLKPQHNVIADNGFELGVSATLHDV